MFIDIPVINVLNGCNPDVPDSDYLFDCEEALEQSVSLASGSDLSEMTVANDRVQSELLNRHTTDIHNNDDDDVKEEEMPPITMELSESTAPSSSESTDNELETVNTTVEVPHKKGKSKQRNKMLRVHGKKYEGLKRKDNSYVVVEREERKLLPGTCSHKVGKKSSGRSFRCNMFDEKQRKDIHDKVWALDTWAEKKSYINGLVSFRQILRRRPGTNVEMPIKHNGYDCYLPGKDGMKLRVCRNYFLATTGLKKDLLNDWIKSFYKTKDSNNYDATEPTTEMKRKRGLSPKGLRNNSKKLKSDSVNKWLEIIPKVPSHYCRASSTRVYVEQDFRSINHMHEIYKEWCQTTSTASVERKKFCEILEKERISVFKPRKDQCDTCVAYKEGNLSEQEYNRHIQKKDDARKAKENAMASISERTLVATMDVQSVLLCPKLLVSKQYYSQKLQIHNFSFYVKNTKDVHLYIWHEGEGKVSANEFTSCIMNFVEINSNYQKIILISDGCTYQNKNRVLTSALSDISSKLHVEIEQIILEKGHTMMEVDSVHSTLERLFTPPIYTPTHYVSKMEAARNNKKNAQPYIIHHLDYNFFKNYEALPSNYSSIRPGKKSGDPTVADVRGLLYKDGEVFYKICHSHGYQPLPQRRNIQNQAELKSLYSQLPKIEKSKFDSLQDLKPYMHRDYHSFYDSLNH